MTPFQQAESEFSCDHPQSEIRLRYDSLKRQQYFRQCLTCGQATSTAIKQSTIPNIAFILTWDQTLEESWQHKRRQRQGNLRTQYEQRQSQWWVDYNAYLLTDEWRMKRLKVLERDNYLCQGCLENRAAQAHHLTYKHLFNEPLFDLVAICLACHDQIHSIDRSQR